ncbi:fimbrial protein [Erwinia papayae]|uniref:Fimbrial protein n=1 Tax=Erwinia papayae TaxID=206499 RepID=A0ABV3N3I7_9GAMM
MKSLLRHSLCTVLYISLFAPLSPAWSEALSVNARFSGTLTENLTPCSLQTVDQNISLGPFTLNSLKNNKESARYPFSVRLENCTFDPEQPADIAVYLTGQGDDSGMLQLSSGSTAGGIVMGFEDMQGKTLPVNATTPGLTLPLNATEIVIQMQAWLRVNDTAKLAAGDFSATLNYVIDYP